ncbi:MAG TPA: carboxymuconolactone decarboxylase family protein [Gammaproteobacteria bacterium]
MNLLEPLEQENAPDASRDVMNSLEGEMGFLPNLYRVLAHSPSALRAYAALNKLVHDTALSPAEQQVVLLAISREHRSDYSIAMHSSMARGAGIDEEELDALRESYPIPNNERHEALRRFTQRVILRRGRLEDDDIDVFLAAGFEERHILDVILAVTMKTLSDYTNHVADTPVDEKYEEMRWQIRQQQARDFAFERRETPGRRRGDAPLPVRGGRWSH